MCSLYLETLSKHDDVRELNRKYLKLNEYLKSAKGESIENDLSDEDRKETEEDTEEDTVNIPVFRRRKKGKLNNPLYYYKFKRNWEMLIKNYSKILK